MKFFVYGKLKSTQIKSFLIPFSKTTTYKLYNHTLFITKKGTAALKKTNNEKDFVLGEIREITFDKIPIIGKFLLAMLLFILDLNEGTFWGVYKRHYTNGFYAYYYRKTITTTIRSSVWPLV